MVVDNLKSQGVRVVNFHHYGAEVERLEAAVGPDWRYIGRASQKHGLAASPLANPYSAQRQAKAIYAENPVEAYFDWLWEQVQEKRPPLIMDELLQITSDTTLVCWCKPQLCHGDVIANLLRWFWESGAAEAWRAERERHNQKPAQHQPQLWGLTIHTPWSHCIVHHTKRLENRTWAPRQLRVGDYLAIHVGQTHDHSPVTEHFVWNKMHAPFWSEEEYQRGHIIGICEYLGYVTTSSNPWWAKGQVGWRLGEPVPIAPVRCRGQRGLWRLPPAVYQQVRHHYRVARQIPSPAAVVQPIQRPLLPVSPQQTYG